MATKYVLPEDRMPTSWYNLVPDLPAPPPPPLNPATREPLGPEDLAPLFPMELIMQEVSAEPYIEIPEEVQEVYKLWRPSPLIRAKRLEKALDTPARIYYKYEGVSPAGSHKPNTSVPQAYYNKKDGTKRLTTETGAGQWGSALSLATQLFGLGCLVYMVRVSFEQKPYRKSMIKAWGADIIPSPSETTEAGRAILAKDPETTGSLGIAISEAVEVAAKDDSAHYSLGSVLNHVMLHQTVTGQEALVQMEMADDEAEVIIGCAGGGSNFAGLAFPYMGENRRNGKDVRIVASEPEACPTMTRGVYSYDFGDTAQLTPLLKMHTLGHDFVPPGIHAGGLRYHGMGPLVSFALENDMMEAVALPQNECFEAAIQFARTEGIIPAPEASHAIASALRVADECRQSGESKAILFLLSGHGHFDMGAYDEYLSGSLEDYAYPEAKIKESMAHLPKM